MKQTDKTVLFVLFVQHAGEVEKWKSGARKLVYVVVCATQRTLGSADIPLIRALGNAQG